MITVVLKELSRLFTNASCKLPAGPAKVRNGLFSWICIDHKSAIEIDRIFPHCGQILLAIIDFYGRITLTIDFRGRQPITSVLPLQHPIITSLRTGRLEAMIPAQGEFQAVSTVIRSNPAVRARERERQSAP
jgi:hypothetical protein